MTNRLATFRNEFRVAQSGGFDRLSSASLSAYILSESRTSGMLARLLSRGNPSYLSPTHFLMLSPLNLHTCPYYFSRHYINQYSYIITIDI